MKKMMTLLGSFNLASLSILGTMNTTSCNLFRGKNVTAPVQQLSEVFKIRDLGDISGETELPTKELIIELLWVKNGLSFDNGLYINPPDYTVDDFVEFLEGPTTTGCVIKPGKRPIWLIAGTIEVTYNYSMIENSVETETNEINSRSSWGGSVESVIQKEVSDSELKKFSTLAKNYSFLQNL